MFMWRDPSTPSLLHIQPHWVISAVVEDEPSLVSGCLNTATFTTSLHMASPSRSDHMSALCLNENSIGVLSGGPEGGRIQSPVVYISRDHPLSQAALLADKILIIVSQDAQPESIISYIYISQLKPPDVWPWRPPAMFTVITSVIRRSKLVIIPHDKHTTHWTDR